MATIGKGETPVRRLLHGAASLVKTPVLCVSLVVDPGGDLAGLYVGDPEKSWSEAAAHSARLHIRRMRRPFDLVIGVAPPMYEDLWTDKKVMYKLEPVVKSESTLVIYAPHITSFSHTWGREIEQVGYHVRDYFLGRLRRFSRIPLGVLAHSTHVKGVGTYENREERPRIQVEIATGISSRLAEKVNLGYRDPGEMSPDLYRGREQEGVLMVDGAGEILYRLA
jgi:hypothetical protein